MWGAPAKPNGNIVGFDVRFSGPSDSQTIPKKPSENYHIVTDSDLSNLGSDIKIQVCLLASSLRLVSLFFLR